MSTEPQLAFYQRLPEPPGLEIRVNFGIFAGRPATAAEDAARGRAARRGGTDCFPPNPPSALPPPALRATPSRRASAPALATPRPRGRRARRDRASQGQGCGRALRGTRRSEVS